MRSSWMTTSILAVILAVTLFDAQGQSDPKALRARVGLADPIPVSAFTSGGFSRAAPTMAEGRQTEQGSLALSIGGSALFGVAGALVGGLIGDILTGECEDFLCELEGVAIGVMVATPLGTAAGAHLGNGRRGNFGYDVLGGAAGLGIAIIIWSAGDDGGVGLFLAGLVPALGFPVFAERRSARNKARRRLESAAVVPTRDGLALSVRVSLN